MFVDLIAHTPDPEKVVAMAAKCCYSNADPAHLADNLSQEDIKVFVQKLMKMGHETPLEHVTFSFAINGISRACLAQLTRHRLASFSVRSQRYCTFRNADWAKIPNMTQPAEIAYQEYLADALDYYNDLLNNYALKKEDARMVLPNAATTALIMTMNARELLHFFALRACTRAQWEIRELANKMIALVKDVAPTIFINAGASCKQLGYCPEGQMSCGLAPTLDKLKESYEKSLNK